MAKTAGSGFLHTKTEKYKLVYPSIKINKNEKTRRIENNITSLKNRELEACQELIDCSSIEDFFVQIKLLFQNAQNDAICLDRFSPEQIHNYCIQRWGNSQQEYIPLQDIELKINLSNEEEIEQAVVQEINNAFSSSNTHIQSLDVSELSKLIGLNEANLTKLLKVIINTVQYERRGKTDKNSKITWNIKSESKSFLREKFGAHLKKEIEQSPYDFIEISTAQQLQKHYTTQLQMGEESPLAKTMDKNSRKNMDPVLLEEMTQDIHNFIMNDLLSGGSQRLMNAAELAWQRNIVKEKNGIALFMKGGSSTAINGGFGEFRGATILNYISNNKKFSAVISDTLKNGEQAKMDVSLLKRSGLQVKNYSLNDTYRFEVNSSLDKLSQYTNSDGIGLSSGQLESLENFLGNLYFNASYQADLSQLEIDLQDYFGEIASFDFLGTVEDTVLFYYIGSNTLIPAHEIYEAVYDKNNQQASMGKIKINFDEQIGSDEEFLQELNWYDEDIDGDPKPNNPLYWWWPIKGSSANGKMDWYALDTNYCSRFNSKIRFNGEIFIKIIENTKKY